MTRPAKFPEWASSGANVLEPSGGKKAEGWLGGEQPPAPIMNWLQKLGYDWLRYLDAEKLLNLSELSSAIPLIRGTTDAADHPSSPGNKWKLAIELPLPDGQFVRLYYGDGSDSGGDWMITVNALWNPAAGAQTFSQDVGAQTSTTLWGRGGHLFWYNKAPGSGSWAPLSWDNLGDLHIGSDLTALRVLAGDFLYPAPVERYLTLNLMEAFDVNGLDADPVENFFWNAAQTCLEAFTSGATAYIPFRLPFGAVIKEAQTIFNQTTSATLDFVIRRLTGVNWSTPAIGSASTMATDTSNSATGIKTSTIPSGGNLNYTVDNAVESYNLLCNAGAAGDRIHGARIKFTVPGLRVF